MYLNSPQSIFPWSTNLSFPVFLGALNKSLHVCHYEMWQSWSWLPDLDLQPEKGLTWLGHTWAVRQDLACRSRRIDNWDERMGGLECLRLAVPICRLPGAAMLLSYYHQSPPSPKTTNHPPYMVDLSVEGRCDMSIKWPWLSWASTGNPHLELATSIIWCTFTFFSTRCMHINNSTS